MSRPVSSFISTSAHTEIDKKTKASVPIDRLPLEQLPLELRQYIFGFLSLKKLFATDRVNHQWNQWSIVVLNQKLSSITRLAAFLANHLAAQQKSLVAISQSKFVDSTNRITVNKCQQIIDLKEKVLDILKDVSFDELNRLKQAALTSKEVSTEILESAISRFILDPTLHTQILRILQDCRCQLLMQGVEHVCTTRLRRPSMDIYVIDYYSRRLSEEFGLPALPATLDCIASADKGKEPEIRSYFKAYYPDVAIREVHRSLNDPRDTRLHTQLFTDWLRRTTDDSDMWELLDKNDEYKTELVAAVLTHFNMITNMVTVPNPAKSTPRCKQITPDLDVLLSCEPAGVSASSSTEHPKLFKFIPKENNNSTDT